MDEEPCLCQALGQVLGMQLPPPTLCPEIPGEACGSPRNPGGLALDSGLPTGAVEGERHTPVLVQRHYRLTPWPLLPPACPATATLTCA